MRHLLQPRVLGAASVAALASALACYPRLSLWTNRPAPIWYLEAVIFICSIMLWGFVFAWHTPYAHRPVFLFKIERTPFLVATCIGIVTATANRWWLDPILQSKFPEEYPPDFNHWLAALPFVLAFNQLFLFFAPFDWAMRLTKRTWAAATLTGLFAAALTVMKVQSLHTPMPPFILALLLAGRFFSAFLIVWFYLRGGVLLVCWWAFLMECRHLPGFFGHS